MASQDGADGGAGGSGATPRSVPGLLQSKKPRSSQDVRRNRLNMEKMIMKNVAGSRIGTKNRAQQIVEALKKKRQQQQQQEGEASASAAASGAAADDAERALKRKKSEPPPPSDAATRTALAAGILSPTRRSNALAPGFTSPARRPTYPPHMKSPTPQLLSPARARGVNPLHLASPVRPSRSAAAASPGRPRRSANTASPLRRSEFLTSPLRHRPSASPKRPLTFDDSTTSTAGGEASSTSTRINGHPPLLSSVLDQVELAPPAKANKVVRSSAKSPFQSFQAKFSKPSPAKPARVTSSPGSARAGPALVIPRSGPTLMDLTHPEESAGQQTTAAAPSNTVLSTSMQDTAATYAADASSGSAAPPGDGDNAAPAPTSSINPAGVPPPAPTRTPNTPSQPPKPVRKLFSSRVVVAQKSICFSTEGVATSVDVTPDGEIVVVGFTDGSVRLYEMDSSVPSDRHGYLLGHIDEQSSQGSFNVHLRVKISPDGRYVFVGCRHTQPRTIMSINLDHYRSEKDGDDDDFQQFQKYFHNSSRLRGFADVTTYVPPVSQVQENKDKRSAYYVLTGLGVGTMNLWRFVEPNQHQEPVWEHLQNFGAGGNTAMVGAFLPSSLSPGVLAIAAACKDKNMRVWPLEFQKVSPGSASESNDDSASEMDDTEFLGGVHTVNTHFNILHTADICYGAIQGQHAYGISLIGEAYRICLPDSSSMSGEPCERLPRQEFELEKIDGSGSSKSRRSNVMLEPSGLAASDDGKAVVAVSTDGIFYYSNNLPAVGSADVVNLRIIGKNASENTLFKAPMRVYTPTITSNGTKTKSEAMMAVATNPSSEDCEDEDGYINVDPTEMFAARWMVPSRGANCWVCGVRNVSHWIGPPESKTKNKEPTRTQLMAEEKERKKVLLRRERALKRAQDAAARQRSSSNGADPDTPSSSRTRTSRAKQSTPKQKDVQSDASADSGSGTPRLPAPGKRRRISQTSAAGDDDDDDEVYTGSDDNAPSVASLTNELEFFKKRNAEIKTEWQRRLLGERQLRRKWKQREEEFLEQLNESLTKLDAAETKASEFRVLLRDAEKRFAFEKARAEQENSVKARYEQLCEQMNEKMALVADQKRLLEQTTRSLLAEVDRNVHALKNAVILEKTECVVCKDQQAVTAVVPCGHLCFCEQDAESYRRNCKSEYPTCPICQQEIVSLLRIYT